MVPVAVTLQRRQPMAQREHGVRRVHGRRRSSLAVIM